MSIYQLKGKIHSFESFGTLDGPGIRFIVFFAGCPLRCSYCHNIDVALGKNFQEMTAEEILQKIIKDKPYLESSGGGVTVSGGEPFSQPIFLKEFLEICKENNIHTTVDTSLFTSQKNIDLILSITDLFMISLKHFDDNIHKKITKQSNKIILKNIKYLSEKKRRIWFRYLIIPGFTDTKENIQALIDFTKTINFELVELLLYHKMGVYKWNEIGLNYELKNVETPLYNDVHRIKKILEKNGLKVILNE